MRSPRRSLRRSLVLCALATTVVAGVAPAAAPGAVAAAAEAAVEAADRFVLRARVDARSTRAHALYVGANDHWTIVDGDGDTDLDCWVYNPAGALVDSDTDATDYCMLQTPGVGQHRVVIQNLGDVYNEYVMRQR